MSDKPITGDPNNNFDYYHDATLLFSTDAGGFMSVYDEKGNKHRIHVLQLAEYVTQALLAFAPQQTIVFTETGPIHAAPVQLQADNENGERVTLFEHDPDKDPLDARVLSESGEMITFRQIMANLKRH